MITEQDLKQAIAECQGERNPNANTCIKLAAYYTIYDQMYGKKMEQTSISRQFGYSTSPPVQTEIVESKIDYSGDSDFAKAMSGKNTTDIMPILDELMSTLSILYPRLYGSVMAKIESI